MKTSLYISFVFFLLSCASSYRKPMRTQVNKMACKMVQQDFDIDTSALRNIYSVFQDFGNSEKEVDILKIWIKDGGAENSYNRIYSANAVAPVLSYRLDKMEKMN